MCSVTFIPQADGFLLGMNRDESRRRARACAPRMFQRAGRLALYPHEESGGTWIGVNDSGLCGALLNWYSMPAVPTRLRASRGLVVPWVLEGTEIAGAGDAVRQLPLRAMAPFRLVVASASSQEVREFRWDQASLAEVRHPWALQHWFSSGHDEPGAQRTRGLAAQQAAGEPDAGTPAWLRRLHASHAPERGPYCMCMHREDAATVSYTEISVDLREATMRYHDGSHCESPEPVSVRRLLMNCPEGAMPGGLYDEGGIDFHENDTLPAVTSARVQ